MRNKISRKIVPERFRVGYGIELCDIFRQRINLFCYITIILFALEVLFGYTVFIDLLTRKDMPGIIIGLIISIILLVTGKFAKSLVSQKWRALLFSLLLILISNLAVVAHPKLISNMGISLVLMAFLSSVLLLPWDEIDAALIGVFTIFTFRAVYSCYAFFPEIVFRLNTSFLVIVTSLCVIVKRSEMVLRQKDFSLRKELEEKNTVMMRELELANKIHSGLMPQSISSEKVDIAVSYKPLLYMGGDYAKFHFINNDRLFFMISDVTGHGVSAALLVNRIHTEIENLIKSDIGPGMILNKLDSFIKTDFGKMGIFLTAFCGVLDFSSNSLQYSNYAHPPQILFQSSDKNIIFLEAQTYLVGVASESKEIYEVKINFNKGDRIFLFTDGVVEARNVSGEQYGLDRLRSFVRENSDLQVARVNERLMTSLRDFQNNQQIDDIFLLSIQIK